MKKYGFGLSMFLLGLVLGSSGLSLQQSSLAQDQEQPDDPGIPKEIVNVVKNVDESMDTAVKALQDEGRYTTVTKGTNSFAVMVGGVDAVADLEAGQGVDPETFAGLYAGEAMDEYSKFVEKDDQGRVTYKGKVVRMYPISKLKKLFKLRSAMLEGTQE